ncbi:MAG: dihydroorotate dehydrogenase electron transfer subunit [Gammaproteobacteria bacterium]|jgi:dihydroorotate dehydrogenase electron transfer subunit|nr:dihydroorotate dehydrogenase electron transfer subunit [Gammaproteobacteria bacterium]
MGKENRSTIFVDEGPLLSIEEFPDQQYIMRIEAPKVAAHAKPGSFVHIRCNSEIPMRRPISLMRVDRSAGWIEIYFKVVGLGLDALRKIDVGAAINLLGPIGNGFSDGSSGKTQLMLGGGVGIPPMLFLAENLHASDNDRTPIVFMGSESPFPFELSPSTIDISGMPADSTSCVPAMEAINIPSRLASLQDYVGVHKGFVTDLAREWLTANPEEKDNTEIFACGPEPMLQAVATLANEFKLDAELCLEEYMACAIGGCAGCAVKIQTANGFAMKRVCVDGPVFNASEIYT